MVGRLGKNVRHHGLLAAKTISDFLVDSQSQQKLATKIFHITLVSVGLVD